MLVDESTAAEKSRTPCAKLGYCEMAVMAGILLSWLVLLAAGLVINSEPYRTALGRPNPPELLVSVWYWFVAITTFTMTNVAMLCCLAALLGAAGGRLEAALTTNPERQHSLNPYGSALIRGFFVYLVAISGLMVVAGEPASASTPDKYLRLAGFLSLLSFLIGFNPQLFTRFLTRIAEVIEGRAGAGEGATAPRR